MHVGIHQHAHLVEPDCLHCFPEVSCRIFNNVSENLRHHFQFFFPFRICAFLCLTGALSGIPFCIGDQPFTDDLDAPVEVVFCRTSRKTGIQHLLHLCFCFFFDRLESFMNDRHVIWCKMADRLRADVLCREVQHRIAGNLLILFRNIRIHKCVQTLFIPKLVGIKNILLILIRDPVRIIFPGGKKTAFQFRDDPGNTVFRIQGGGFIGRRICTGDQVFIAKETWNLFAHVCEIIRTF